MAPVEAASTASSTSTFAPLVRAASACCCCLAASWSALEYSTSQSGHSSLTLASKSGLSLVSYRAVVFSGARSAIFPPPEAAAPEVSLLAALSSSPPHALAPNAIAPTASRAITAPRFRVIFTSSPLILFSMVSRYRAKEFRAPDYATFGTNATPLRALCGPGPCSSRVKPWILRRLRIDIRSQIGREPGLTALSAPNYLGH